MHSEQDINDLDITYRIALINQWKIDAENAAIAKGFSDVSTGDSINDIEQHMYSSFPGFKFKDARVNLISIASDHEALVGAPKPTRVPYTVNPVGCTSDKMSGNAGDDISLTITCPSTHSLPNAPMFYRVLIDTSYGIQCAWVMDPV